MPLYSLYGVPFDEGDIKSILSNLCFQEIHNQVGKIEYIHILPQFMMENCECHRFFFFPSYHHASESSKYDEWCTVSQL